VPLDERVPRLLVAVSGVRHQGGHGVFAHRGSSFRIGISGQRLVEPGYADIDLGVCRRGRDFVGGQAAIEPSPTR